VADDNDFDDDIPVDSNDPIVTTMQTKEQERMLQQVCFMIKKIVIHFSDCSSITHSCWI
jgi:hypothetical protein